MARWRLTQPHYLNVAECQWLHTEIDTKTSRPLRKMYNVPQHLDPREQGDHNYPGEVIVSDGVDAYPADIIFKGPPTPDMEPLDDAAKDITEKHRPSWIHPIDSLPVNFSQSLFDMFQMQLTEAMQKQEAVKKTAPQGITIDPAAFEQMQKQLQELMLRNAALEEKLLKNEEGDDEPLPDLDEPAPPPPSRKPLERRV